MRWGLGPAFFYECLANSRRWQTYAIRSAGVALLLAAIATIAMPNTTIDPRYALQKYAALGESYFYGLIGVELTLVMLAAPAATATSPTITPAHAPAGAPVIGSSSGIPCCPASPRTSAAPAVPAAKPPQSPSPR